MWRVSPRLRQMVRWRRINLLDAPDPAEVWDVILCRNVLSDFEDDIRRVVLERMAGVLAEDGRLVLGLSETVHGLTDALRPVPGRRGLYAATLRPRGGWREFTVIMYLIFMLLMMFIFFVFFILKL